jgi:hypothetical protein
MNLAKKQANDGVTELLQHLDSGLHKKRPVTFWFYSDSESKLYRTAHELQKDHYEIQYCGRSACSNEWLLIAEKQISPGPEIMEHLLYHFEELAQNMGITFDGWETQIVLE